MQKLYVRPTDIEVSVVLNNREMDQNYVADLTQSMQEKGFLPEYPIEVVPAANLPNIETQLPYICVNKVRGERKEFSCKVTDDNIIIFADALMFFSEDVGNIEIPQVSPRKDRSRTVDEVLEIYSDEQMDIAARIDDPRIEATLVPPAKPIVVDFGAAQIAHEEESAFVEDRHYDKAERKLIASMSKTSPRQEPHEAE